MLNARYCRIILPSLAASRPTPFSVRCTPTCCSITMEGRDRCGIDRELGTVEQWLSVHHDFQSSPVVHRHFQFHVSNPHVGGHPTACFSADARCHAHQRKAHSDPALPPGRMRRPKMSGRRPHLHTHEAGANGRRKRRNKRIRKT